MNPPPPDDPRADPPSPGSRVGAVDSATRSARAGAPLARLVGAAKRFGEVEALKPTDLDVRRGEVLGLVGPNGAGKTTALRILCGILAPDEGRAEVAGHDVLEAPREARQHLAFVPDGAPLYPNLSPRQHLHLVGRLHGLAEPALRAEAERLVAALDLADRIDAPVGTFSRGMRQKTALACALLPAPALLVLDEPLSGLDAPTTVVFKEVLRAWADRGAAVLYTSHLLDVVERVCDRVAILAAGELVAVGDLAELRRRAGREGTLEEVFGLLTRSQDPRARAERLLDGLHPRG